MCNLTDTLAFTAQSNPAADINIWHRRLGHVNLSYMKQLRNKAATGIEFLGEPKSCTICVDGKMIKKPFKLSSSRVTEKLQLIHSDLCQVDAPSIGKATYFLTFVDDYSRKIFINFLSKKDQVYKSFKDFKAYVENQTNCKIKVLRSDNGSEYLYPKRSLQGKTPEEVWSGSKPNLRNLRIFGCDAKAYLPSKFREKLDVKSIDCKMLGYEPNRKAYRSWYVAKGRVISARYEDVVF